MQPAFRRPLFLAPLALLLALCGCLSPPLPIPAQTPRSLRVGDQLRAYLLFSPGAAQAAPSGTTLPLVLAFHGGGGTAAGMADLTGLNAVAEREGFFVAYPQGIGGNWNDGRPGINDGVDDVAFVRALLDELAATLPIDPARIYATGLSNGGHFCHRLAFDLPGRIAAIAPVAAALSTALAARTEPLPPTPILMIMGDADPIAPYRGGPIGFGSFVDRGEMLSVAAAAQRWAAANGAKSTPDVSYLPDTAPKDGTRVRRDTYSSVDPAAPAPVIVLTVEGGGHTWPGGRQYLPTELIGRTNRDTAATDTIWSFLHAFLLR